MSNKKSIGYEVRGKSCPGSRLTFTGIIDVPEGSTSGTVHTNIKAYWGGNSNNIRGLHSVQEVDGAWTVLADAVREGLHKQEDMIPECWTRLQQKKKIRPEEVKRIIDKTGTDEVVLEKGDFVKEAKTRAGEPLKDKYVLNPGKFENAGNGKQTSQAAARPSPPVKDGNDVLVWHLEQDGNPGRRFAFDEKMQKQIAQVLAQKPNMAATDFYIECGIKILPYLHGENASLRGRLEKLQEDFNEVSAHRDTLLSDAMHSGSMEIGEVGKTRAELAEAKAELAAAKAGAASQRELIGSLQEQIKNKDVLKEVIEKLNDIQLSSNKAAEEMEKTAKNTDKIVDKIGVVGENSKRGMRLWTPAAKKLKEGEAEWILAAPINFFHVVGSYRSIGNDVEKLVKIEKIEQMTLEGEGSLMANDFIRKKNLYGSWDGKFVVLIVDGAELMEEEDLVEGMVKAKLESMGKFLSMAFEESNPKEVVIVAGPSENDKTEEGRKIIIRRMLEIMPEIKVLNMSQAARQAGDGTLVKWCKGQKWSALATAQMMSRLVWWAEAVEERDMEEGPHDICQECGLTHEAKNCFKHELPVAKDEESQDSDKREDTYRRDDSNKRSEANRRNVSTRRDDYRSNVPQCQVPECGKFHTGKCRLLMNRTDRRGEGYRGGQSTSKMIKLDKE